MTEISPASNDAVRLSTATGLGGREQIILTVRISEDKRARRIETLFSWYEARRVAHALLDRCGAAGHGSVAISPQNNLSREQLIRVTPSAVGGATLAIDITSDREDSFAVALTSEEAYQLGHMLLAAANPSRSASGDD